MKINLLSSEVYTQIAAGEVVESPRSIVKELVENSIDAGATAVTIYIEEGGLKSITVSDNGIGIESTEVEKAFLPHATSKIATINDLLSIGTLGFRGEALASIAAVSEVILDTRYKDDEQGTRIVVKGGETLEKTVSSIDCGTNITVSNLFFNTPARFKFLKSAKTEENNVTAIVQGLILANPSVSFTYYIDGKLKYFNAEIGLEAACETVFKTEFIYNSLRIYEKVDDVTLEGYISTPSLVRGNRGGQFLIINGRVVNDASITAVVQNAYGARLMTRSFPVYCLTITMNPEDVDVNVHPNKTEVRLSTPKRIGGIIYHSVQKVLDQYDSEKYAQYIGARDNGQKDDSPTANSSGNDVVEEPKYSSGRIVTPPSIDYQQQEFDFEAYRRQNTDEINSVVTVAENDYVAKDSIPTQVNPSINNTNFTIIGQIFNTYLIIQFGNEEVYIIDQHAAHERIRYDRYMEELDKDDVKSQLLMMPITLYLDAADLTTLEIGKRQLEAIGFDLKIDDEKVDIFAVPLVLVVANLNIKNIIQDIIEEFKESDSLKLSKILKEKIALKACRGAIKGGDSLSVAQIGAFLDYYIKNGMPLQCPHGRPAIIRLEQSDLEKLFKRII